MNLNGKRSFKSEKAGVLGLDIGSSKVKLIQLRKAHTGYAVAAAGIVDIAGDEDGNEDTEMNTVRATRKCFKSSAAGTHLAVCSVCGPEVAVRDFKFPSLPEEEIEGAILLEASQVCPFNLDNGTVDYQLVPNGEDDVSGVLVAATNKLINNKVQLAKEASLNCVLMDVDGLALLNCFQQCEECDTDPVTSEKGDRAGQTIAILNVGSSYTTLAIMTHGGTPGLPFIRDIAYAGNDIVNTIAAKNDMPIEAVKNILSGGEDLGLDTAAQGNDALALQNSLKKACRKLIADVSETLRYYVAAEKSAVIEKIFVCGGFALVKSFVELLDDQLTARVVLWNPFDKMRCDADQPCGDILASKGPAMAVAAGLAMRSI